MRWVTGKCQVICKATVPAKALDRHGSTHIFHDVKSTNYHQPKCLDIKCPICLNCCLRSNVYNCWAWTLQENLQEVILSFTKVWNFVYLPLGAHPSLQFQLEKLGVCIAETCEISALTSTQQQIVCTRALQSNTIIQLLHQSIHSCSHDIVHSMCLERHDKNGKSDLLYLDGIKSVVSLASVKYLLDNTQIAVE